MGGIVGMFGGAWAGYHLEDDLCTPCGGEGLLGMFFGAAAGSALSIPVAVHLANDREGVLGYSLAASVGIGALGLAGAYAMRWSNTGALPLLLIPVAQVIVTVNVEQSTSRPPR